MNYAYFTASVAAPNTEYISICGYVIKGYGMVLQKTYVSSMYKTRFILYYATFILYYTTYACNKYKL